MGGGRSKNHNVHVNNFRTDKIGQHRGTIEIQIDKLGKCLKLTIIMTEGGGRGGGEAFPSEICSHLRFEI